MSSGRFVLFSLAIFVVGALPFLILQPSAAASAGLSLGFAAPLEHIAVVALLVLCGLTAALLPKDGLMFIPLAFAIMIMAGGLVMLSQEQFPYTRYFILGTVLCMGLLVGMIRHKATLLAVLIVGSVGFHLGGFYLDSVPPIAAPMYYLLGVLLSLALILAISVAFGVTLFGDHEAWVERVVQSPRLAWLRNLFS